MKNQMLLALAVSTLFGGAAIAADVAVPVKAAPRVACAADVFRGGYIGIHGGGVGWTANRTDHDGFTAGVGTGDTIVQKKWGGVVGGQLGHNWTTCNTLWGLEVDGSWTNVDQTTNLFPNTLAPLNLGVTSRLDALVTARARTGIVIDSLLLYVTGGVAAARTRTEWFLADPVGPPAGYTTATINDWRWGWTVGFGTEWAWSDRISIRTEALYVDLADRQTKPSIFASHPSFASNIPFTFTRSDSMWIGRVALNYRFGGPTAAWW